MPKNDETVTRLDFVVVTQRIALDRHSVSSHPLSLTIEPSVSKSGFNPFQSLNGKKWHAVNTSKRNPVSCRGCGAFCISVFLQGSNNPHGFIEGFIYRRLKFNDCCTEKLIGAFVDGLTERPMEEFYRRVC